jgi:hypothetical protein
LACVWHVFGMFWRVFGTSLHSFVCSGPIGEVQG